jgi:eukaryotic-like serine/threonine-protein kinase
MDTRSEIEVMRLFECALEQPPELRPAWLRQQDAAPDIIARVAALLAKEAGLTRFLERPAVEDARVAPLVRMPAAGDRIGAWRLLHELDAGGMGVVFVAERADGAYEQRAAVKFVRTDHLLDARRRDEIVARFGNERRLLARIEHPNVARVLDGGSIEGMPYLVMEYVEGVALNVWCEQRGLDVPARVEVFCKVCDGVQAAHAHLIVHRDLKPQNILVGEDGEPRLLDFGIARLLDVEAGSAATRTALHAMTPAYASPEQMRLEPLTTASDVYSLGVVLYELLSGTRPYSLDGLSPAQSERIVCDTDPQALRRALAGADLPEPERRARLARIGGDLERIVAKALHKEPARRYDSARALADDLRRCLAGRPVQAHPDSATYRWSKFVRRHRVGSAAAAVALAAVVTAGAIALVQARNARRAATDTALVNSFLIDVLKESNPYATGSEITLGEALDEAAKKVDERFGDRPDLAVSIRNALGESMFARYRLEAAEVQLLRARADAERVFGADDLRTITAIATLASVRKDQDRIDEAQALFDEALQRIERSGQTAQPVYATVLNDLGVMYLVQEDFARAKAYLERAVASDRGSDQRAAVEERARTLANLAQAARGTGDLERADALYRQAQPVLEALYPEGGPHLAVILNNRARLAWVRGNKDEAIDLQQQAVAMHRRSFDGDHVMVLVPMTNLARQALDTGKLELAVEWAEKAAAMSDRLYPEASHHYQVNALAALAAVRLAQARVADAKALLQRARTLLAGLDNAPASTRDQVAALVARACGADGGDCLD